MYYAYFSFIIRRKNAASGYESVSRQYGFCVEVFFIIHVSKHKSILKHKIMIKLNFLVSQIKAKVFTRSRSIENNTTDFCLSSEIRSLKKRSKGLDPFSSVCTAFFGILPFLIQHFIRAT